MGWVNIKIRIGEKVLSAEEAGEGSEVMQDGV